jgi:sugar phosphate permease
MADISTSIASKAASLGYTSEEYAKFKKHAWIMLAMFCILYCFLYGGRLNLGLAIPLMTTQMGWTKTELGILSSVLFWTYGFGHLFNGRLGEIFGVKRFIVAGAILSAATNVLISFQDSLLLIAILWGFNGYFQSMLWSPGMALLSRWWPGNTRGFATGLANGSSGLGQVVTWYLVAIAFFLVPGSTGEGDWRAAFTIPIIGILIVVGFFYFLTKGQPADVGLKEYKEAEPEREEQETALQAIVASKGKLYPYVHLFSQWRFILWCLIVAGSNTARYGLLTWIPSYYKEALGMDVKAGIVGSVWLPLGMALGTFIVPWITDKYCSTNRLPAVIICALIAGATVFLFPYMTDPFIVAAVLFLAGFFIYAINGVVWAYATDIGGRVFSGTAAGILDWAAYMGAAVQAIIFGAILDTGAWNILFIAVGGLCVINAVFAVLAGIGNKKIE